MSCPSTFCCNNRNERNALNNVSGLQYSTLQPVPILVFWNTTTCLSVTYMYQSVLLPLSGLKYLEDGGSKLLQNADIHILIYTALCTRSRNFHEQPCTSNLELLSSVRNHFSLYTFHIAFQFLSPR